MAWFDLNKNNLYIVCRLQTAEDGDYKFCLDNSFSHFSSKVVFFEILTDDPDPSWNVDHFENIIPEDLTTYEMKLEDFMVRIRVQGSG